MRASDWQDIKELFQITIALFGIAVVLGGAVGVFLGALRFTADYLIGK